MSSEIDFVIIGLFNNDQVLATVIKLFLCCVLFCLFVCFV